MPCALAVVLWVSFAVFGPTPLPAATAAHGGQDAGAIELDMQSEFSHIRVRKRGSMRTLVFVRDNGEEAIESQLNLRRPQDLLVPYSRYMFAAYLLRPRQQQVLIVGLGGGSMVHFLRFHDPELKIDAVEIDPAVVKIADEHFGVRSGGNVNVINADAFRFLEESNKQYDAIYMDAFLKPAADTDATGVPLRLKTVRFYKRLQEKLKPGGVVAFNVNTHAGAEEDIKTIRSAFAHVYVFRVGETNYVAVASTAAEKEKAAAIRARAHDLDHRFKTSFSFSQMVPNLLH